MTVYNGLHGLYINSSENIVQTVWHATATIVGMVRFSNVSLCIVLVYVTFLSFVFLSLDLIQASCLLVKAAIHVAIWLHDLVTSYLIESSSTLYDMSYVTNDCVIL